MSWGIVAKATKRFYTEAMESGNRPTFGKIKCFLDELEFERFDIQESFVPLLAIRAALERAHKINGGSKLYADIHLRKDSWYICICWEGEKNCKKNAVWIIEKRDLSQLDRIGECMDIVKFHFGLGEPEEIYSKEF